jgi:transcriptional regulator with XRE-family HTH domain
MRPPRLVGKNPERTAALAALLRGRLAALGISANHASLAAGLERTAVRDIYRGSQPTVAKLRALAPVLDVSIEEMLALMEDPAEARPPPQPGDLRPRRPRALADRQNSTELDVAVPHIFDAGDHDLVLVRQEAGMDGGFVDMPVSRIARPHSLAMRHAAYAVYVADDLNAPLVRTGHIAYVDPSRPIQPDRPARVFPRDGAPFLAIVEAHSDEGTRVRVASESGPRMYAAEDIERLERVVAFSMLDE